MALPTFGVDATMIGQQLRGFEAALAGATWTARLADWLQQAAAEVADTLRSVGYDEDEADGEGVESVLYSYCQQAIEARVTARVIRAITLQEPELVDQYERKAAEMLAAIRTRPETKSDDWTAEQQLGSFRARRGHSRSMTRTRRSLAWRKVTKI